MKYDLAIFDLDGTLTDSKEGIIRTFQHTLKKYGIVRSDEELMKYIGPPIFDIFREILNTNDESEILCAVNTYRERFNKIGYLENTLYSGAVQMLERLKRGGVKLAVATSKPQDYAVLILQNFKIDNYFDYVCGASMDGSFAEKRDLIAAVLKAVPHSHPVMVGDRFYDLCGASEVGIDCIGAGYGYAPIGELERYPNVFIADTPESIADFILE